jgi:hypothetical protein
VWAFAAGSALSHRGTGPCRVYCTAGTIQPMTPQVEVDADLAARAAEIATARGESLEDVIRRALSVYVDPPEPSAGRNVAG